MTSLLHILWPYAKRLLAGSLAGVVLAFSIFWLRKKSSIILIGRDYGLDRLYAKAHPDNKASVRIIERLGFSFERVLEGLTGDDEECNGEWLYVLTR
ncbi:GNAT family N-acetyltransferase [Brevibacillus sp. HB2.2]|uniref:GNAT family N-acetyltransferase n=1 Tax=Brevibacillus sp. HB2.2 TaxID=2738846 RepID=UPI0020C58E90|nr:GNAT family protein [Brevibacillus sp. HB2.2]